MHEEHAIGMRRRAGFALCLTVLSIPTMWWVIASGALHNFNMYALGQFLASFLIRYHHVSASETPATSRWWSTDCPGSSGWWAAAMLADRLYQKRVDGRSDRRHGSIVICAPLMYLALLQPGGAVLSFSLLMGIGCGVMYAYYSTVYSTIQDVVEPDCAERGWRSIFLRCTSAVRRSDRSAPAWRATTSPSVRRRPQAKCSNCRLAIWSPGQVRALFGGPTHELAAGSEPFRAEGLHSAMFIVPAIAAVLAVVLFAASKTVKNDVARLRAWMSAAA